MNKQQLDQQHLELFAANLARLRKRRGFTSRKALADYIDAPRSLIGYYEKAQKEPGYTMLCRLCEALDVSASELMCENELRRQKKMSS